MKSAKLWTLLAVILAGSTSAIAQSNPNEEQGLKPYDSWHGGDLDSVSLTNGGLVLHIPLASFPQRGNLDLSFMLRFSSKQWRKVVLPGSHGRTVWQPADNTGSQIISSMDWWLTDTDSSDPTSPWSALSASSPDGNNHSFSQASSAINCLGTQYRSLDATGLLRADCNTVIMPNGTHYNYVNGHAAFTAVQPSSVTDANGNQITLSSSGWTDTMGRVIPGSAADVNSPIFAGVPTSDLTHCPSGTVSATIWNVPGVATVNGGIRTYYFCYSNFTVAPTFGNATPVYGPGTWPLLSAIVLPDSTSWTFNYDAYGDVTRLGFPTGGSISYSYLVGPVNCGTQTPQSMWVSSRTVDANDGTGPHIWNYSYQFPGATLTSTVTSPDGNDTVHTIGAPVAGVTGCSRYELQVQYFQGPASGNNVLKTVQTQYNGNAGHAGLPSATINVVPTQVTTTWHGGTSSHIVRSYDPSTTNADGQPVIVGSLLQSDDYDFSNTLVRSTVNHYLWQDNGTYAGNNFVSLPLYSMVKTAAGCETSKASFGYDETYHGITLQPSGISTQHGAPPGAVRGNRTSSSKWLISACAEQSAIVSHAIPYDTGLPYQSYDQLGHVTQYTYASTFAGAYLTQTNMPDTQMPDTGAPIVHHVISGNYDLNTGLLTSFTDENSQQYTYTYDIMLRLTQGNHPDAGLTRFFYPDPNTVERQRLITGATYDDYKVKFDGLGRPYQTQQTTPSGTVLADTVYDSVGRIASVSNPYFQGSNHATDPTYGVTSTLYDALSRTIKTTKQDGSFATVTYADNCTTAIDESGKARKSCSDAFGRMVTVFEDPSALNYETDYQYDVLNNMLRVDQKGSAPTDITQWRTRLFTYDSLSRIITALNPEAGTTCYGIWSGGNCINGYDSNGNLLKKTDARNITITYAYDALNRLTDKTYSDGTQNASYRYDYSSFLGQTFAYPIGRQVAATAAGNTIESFTSYDQMGRVANTVQCNPGVTGCKTFTANYDKLGDLASLAYPGNGFSVTYGYDSAARLTTATDSNGVIYAQNPTYLASAAIQEFTSPNFNSNKYHVDYNSRLQTVEIWTGTGQGASALFDKQYSYGTSGSNNGNIFTITNVKDSTRTQTFTYDALNRLASAQDATHWSNVYTYDAWGNLTKKLYGAIPSGEHLDTSATPQNWMLGYTYDAAGNMQSDGASRYSFDAENRIACMNPDVNWVCNTNSISYTYDADGRRVKKSSGTNYWYGPGGDVLAETDNAGVWTNYIFFGGQRLARNVSGDIKYYITDHLHSTAMFVDKAGTTAAILDDNDMYPWGGVVPGVGKTTSNNTVKFTGQYRDTESQLDYFGARYYSNTIGRFMSPDWAAKPTSVPYAKFGDPQSLNLYSYTENGPVNRIDADGHEYARMDTRTAGGGDGIGTYTTEISGSDDGFSFGMNGTRGPDVAGNATAPQGQGSSNNGQQQHQNVERSGRWVDVPTDLCAAGRGDMQRVYVGGEVDYNNHAVSDPAVRSGLMEISVFFGRTVSVTSGDRNFVPEGGAKNSEHLTGHAADFHVSGVTDSKAFAAIHSTPSPIPNGFKLIQHGPNTVTQGPHLHLDTSPGRGNPSRFLVEGLTPQTRGIYERP